jgi:anti-sigma factor RsiW
MTCEHVTASLHDYMAHTLPPKERARVDEHILICPSCARVASEYEVIVRAAHTLTPPTPPAGMEQRLREALAQVMREHADRAAVVSGDAPVTPS